MPDRMSKPQHGDSDHDKSTGTWWGRLCGWLWKTMGFLGAAVILALIVNVFSTWLTTPKGAFPPDTPLSFLLAHWPTTISVGCCFLLLAFLFRLISQRATPSWSEPI